MTIKRRVARLEAIRADLVRSAERAAADALREFPELVRFVPSEVSDADLTFLEEMVAWSIGGRTPPVSDDVLARYHLLLETIDGPATSVARQDLGR
jgi:hypothetical protein